MRFALLLVAVLSSPYFVEWIPNNLTASTSSSPGEFPWQLSGGGGR